MLAQSFDGRELDGDTSIRGKDVYGSIEVLASQLGREERGELRGKDKRPALQEGCVCLHQLM